MPRPEVDIDFTVPERGELAARLRSLRSAKAITYQQLVMQTGGEFSASHYKRAASGKELPSIEVVLSYAFGCVDSLTWELRDELIALHRAAAEAVDKAGKAERRSTTVPKPELVRSVKDLSTAMRDAWARAGRPSMRKIEKKADVFVPHSTAHAIVTGRTVPRDLQQYLNFLEACDIDSPEQLHPWLTAWLRAWGIPLDPRQIARDRRWMDQATADAYAGAIVAVRAERYDAGHVLRLLTHAVDRALDTINHIDNVNKRNALVSSAYTLAHLAEVQEYMRKNTNTTYTPAA
ncbi:hypothetical protein ACFU3J_16195 [Streptomyces sp. NPDC057411]|uniref:hypothetical protein n=1 Tax=unclassified Streptomyces TaxID=2593676 RepID=UPI003631532B